VDLESGICGDNGADHGEQLAFAVNQRQAAGQDHVWRDRRTETSPNCAWTKLVMVTTAALDFASGVRNTPHLRLARWAVQARRLRTA
jgi:hypothetical protein